MLPAASAELVDSTGEIACSFVTRVVASSSPPT